MPSKLISSLSQVRCLIGSCSTTAISNRENDLTRIVELSLVKSCNYGATKIVESLLRDQIVLGVANEQVREKIFFLEELSLAKACSIVRACESASSQLTQMVSRLDSSANHLNDRPTRGKPPSSQSSANRQGFVK